MISYSGILFIVFYLILVVTNVFCVKSKSNCVLGSVHIERVTLRPRLRVTQFLHSHLAINIATKFATKNEMGLITIFVTKLSEELCV